MNSEWRHEVWRPSLNLINNLGLISSKLNLGDAGITHKIHNDSIFLHVCRTCEMYRLDQYHGSSVMRAGRPFEIQLGVLRGHNADLFSFRLAHFYPNTFSACTISFLPFFLWRLTTRNGRVDLRDLNAKRWAFGHGITVLGLHGLTTGQSINKKITSINEKSNQLFIWKFIKFWKVSFIKIYWVSDSVFFHVKVPTNLM